MQPSGRTSGLTSEPFWFEDPPPGGAPWGALAAPIAAARIEPAPVASERRPPSPAAAGEARVPLYPAIEIEWERRRPLLPPTEAGQAVAAEPEIVVRRLEPDSDQQHGPEPGPDPDPDPERREASASAKPVKKASVWVPPIMARAYPRLFDHELLDEAAAQRGPAWASDEGWADESAPERKRGRRPGGWRRIRFGRIGNAGTIVLVCVAGTWAVVPHDSASASRAGKAVIVERMSAYAVQLIPSDYRRIYLAVAREYGLDWSYLAAVGQIESRQGRSTAPGVRSGANWAGASGPAQFLASTWERYGVNVDGHGLASPYDPADAITSMAAYLKASGAPQNWPQALFAYNRSEAYVQAVLTLAARLRTVG
jgi:hypothetical protein